MVPDRIGSDSGTFNLNCTPVCAGRRNSVRKKHLYLSQSDRTILPGLRNDKVTASDVARKGLGKSYTESGFDSCSCIVSFLYGEYHALPCYEETGIYEVSGHGGDLRKPDFYGAAMYRAEYHTFYIRKKSQPALYFADHIVPYRLFDPASAGTAGKNESVFFDGKSDLGAFDASTEIRNNGAFNHIG